jgi:hypothetical protein
VAILRVVVERLHQLGGRHHNLREGAPHGANRVLDEPRLVDVGVVSEDVVGDLVEDLVVPAHVERVQRGEREEKVSERRRVQDARVENDDHL